MIYITNMQETKQIVIAARIELLLCLSFLLPVCLHLLCRISCTTSRISKAMNKHISPLLASTDWQRVVADEVVEVVTHAQTR